MAELEGITGKVAEIIDRYSLIINRGEEAGVNVGMVFLVMGLGGDVIDPETGVSLGPKPIEKLRVKVREVYPKFSVAETYRIVTPPDITSFVREHSRWPTAMEVFGPQGPERERFANSRRPTNRRRQARSLASRSTIPCGNWCTKFGPVILLGWRAGPPRFLTRRSPSLQHAGGACGRGTMRRSMRQRALSCRRGSVRLATST